MTFLSDDDFVRLFQLRAKMHGFFDGVPLGNAGPLTMRALDRVLPPLLPSVEKRPPWIAVGLETWGWHERLDNDRLSAFLKRDGRTLGDPAALPWCGDWVETTMRLALPHEIFPGALGANPYWARNWEGFGRALAEPALYSVVGFSRPGGGGHVGYAVAQDATHLHVFGGNQGDRVNVVRIEKPRLLFSRWPSTYQGTWAPLPVRDPGAIPTSTNEV